MAPSADRPAGGHSHPAGFIGSAGGRDKLLYEERSEPERAHAGYRDALQVIERVAARLQDPARRRTFLAAQPVRQIRAGAARTRARMDPACAAPTSRTCDERVCR